MIGLEALIFRLDWKVSLDQVVSKGAQ